jgi:hypothetical protein
MVVIGAMVSAFALPETKNESLFNASHLILNAVI